MKTMMYWISAFLAMAFIVPACSVAYGRFEPKQPPITDPYNPQAYMRELAKRLTEAEADILLRGIEMPSVARPPVEFRRPIIVPGFTPTFEEDRAAIIPEVPRRESRTYVPPAREVRPESVGVRTIYYPDKTERVLEVFFSNVLPDELPAALAKANLVIVRLRGDPRIYATRDPRRPPRPRYITGIVVDSTGKQYLLCYSPNIARSELIQALGAHPSRFRLVEESDLGPALQKPKIDTERNKFQQRLRDYFDTGAL
jgi:hypothetical protein